MSFKRTMDKAIRVLDDSDRQDVASRWEAYSGSWSTNSRHYKDEIFEYLYTGTGREKLNDKAKAFVNKGLKSFISEYKRYMNQAKRGQGPWPHEGPDQKDVKFYEDKIKVAERMML